MEYIRFPLICTEAMLALADAERGRLLKAVLLYATTGSTAEPCGSERGLYLVLRSQMDADRAVAGQKAEAGRKGGLARSSNLKQTLAEPSTSSLPPSPPIPPLSPNLPPDIPPKEKPPKGGKKKAPHAEAEFSAFWASYPNHRSGRANAFKSWLKVNPDGAYTAAILSAVEKQKQWPQWLQDNGAYIPMATTWLNQRRWDAENEPAPQDNPPASRSYHIEFVDGEEVVVYDD